MTNVNELYAIGIAAQKKGRLKSALKAFRAAARTDSNYRPAFVKLGELYSHAKRPDLAIGFFQRALKLEVDAAVLFNIGSESYRLEKMDDSIKYLKGALKQDRRLIKAHLLIAFIYRTQDLHEKACIYFQNVRKLEPSNRMASLGEAIALSEMKHFTQARDLIINWQKQTNKQDPAFLELLAGLQLQLGNSGASYQEFSKLSKSSKKFTSFTDHLSAAQHAQDNEFKECFANLDTRISDKVKNLKQRIEVRKKLAKGKRDLSAKSNGIEGAQDLEGELKDDLKDMVDISLMHLFNGDSDKALKFLFQAHKMGKDT